MDRQTGRAQASRERPAAAPEHAPLSAPAPRVQLAARVRELTRLVGEDASRTGALSQAQFAAMLTAGERVMGKALGIPGRPLLDNPETRLVWSAQLTRISPSLGRAPDDAVRRLIAVLPRILGDQRRPGLTDELCVNFGFDVALRRVARELALVPEPVAVRARTAGGDREIARAAERAPAQPIAQHIDSGRAESIRDHYRGIALDHPRLSIERLAEHHVQAILAEGAMGARAAARAEGRDHPDYTRPATLRGFSERLEGADRLIRETDLAPLLARYQSDAARAVYTTYLQRLELPLPASSLPRALLERGPEQPYDDGLHGVPRQTAAAWRARDRAWQREFAEAKHQAPLLPPSRATYVDERVGVLTARGERGERGERGMDDHRARGRAQAEFAHARAVQDAVFKQSRLEGDHARIREAFWQGLLQARTQLDPVRPDEARPAIAAILGRQAETVVERAGDAYKQARLDTRGEGHIGAGRTHVDTARKELERARDTRAALASRTDQVHAVLHEHAVRFHTLVQEHGPPRGTLTLAREIHGGLPAALQGALFVDSRETLSQVEREQRRARGEQDRYLPGPLLADLTTLARDGRQFLTRLATQHEIAHRLEHAVDGAAARALRDAAAGRVRAHDPLAIGIITAPAVLDGRQVTERLATALLRRPQARVLVAGGDAGRAIYQQVTDLAERAHTIEPAYFSTTWTDVPAAREDGPRRSPQRAVVDGLLAARAAGHEAVLLVVHHDKRDPALERLAAALEARGMRVEQLIEPAPTVPRRPPPADARPQTAESRLAAARAADLPDQVIRLAAQTIPIWRDLQSREQLGRALLPDVESRLVRMDAQIHAEQLRAVEMVGKAAVTLAKLVMPTTGEQRDALSTAVGGLRGYYADLRASQGAAALPRPALATLTAHARLGAGRMDRVLAHIADVGQIVGDRQASDREHSSAIAAALTAALAHPGIDARRAQAIRLDIRTLAAHAHAHAQPRAPRGVPAAVPALDRARALAPHLGEHGRTLATAIAQHEGTGRVLDAQQGRAARAVVATIDTLRGPVPPGRSPLDESLAAIRTYYDRLGRTGSGGRFPADQVGVLRESAGTAASLAAVLGRGDGTLELLAWSRETLGHAAQDHRSITGRQLAALDNTPGHRAALRARAERAREDRTAEIMATGLGAYAAAYFGAAAALRVSQHDARPAERYFRFLDLQEDIREHLGRLEGRLHAQPALRAAYQRADGSLDLERVARERPRLATVVREHRALQALSQEIADAEHVDLTRHTALRDRHLNTALREAGRVMVDMRARGLSDMVVQLWARHTLVERALDPARAHNQAEHDFYGAERAHAMSVLDYSVSSLQRITEGLQSGRTAAWARARLTDWAKQDPTRFPTAIGGRETLRALRPDVTALARSPADLASLADLLATIRTPRAERDEPELGEMNSRDREARSYQEQRRAEQHEREHIATAERGVEEQLLEMIDDLTGLRFA